MIQAIINANKNLKESNERNDWEMMGADIKELQNLIESLEKMMQQKGNTEQPLKTNENEEQEDGIINSIFQNVIN